MCFAAIKRAFFKLEQIDLATVLHSTSEGWCVVATYVFVTVDCCFFGAIAMVVGGGLSKR